METKLIIERLQLTIDNLKKLKPEQFNYAEVVSEFDEEKGCGTVCCVMGFYPVWYPDHFKYHKNRSDGNYSVIHIFEDYHGITRHEKYALFYGERLDNPKIDSVVHKMCQVTIPEVIERFETLKRYYESKV